MSTHQQPPRYAPYVQPGAQTQGQGSHPQPTMQTHGAPAPGSSLPFNALGLVATIVVGLYIAYAVVQPFMYRLLMDVGSITILATVNGTLLVLTTLVAIGLAVASLLAKRQRRAMWLSWVALGAASAILLQGLLTMLGNWAAFQVVPY